MFRGKFQFGRTDIAADVQRVNSAPLRQLAEPNIRFKVPNAAAEQLIHYEDTDHGRVEKSMQ